jgi:hypothetical protein
MRVRIKATPKEREIDGISLKGLHPGEVREVSPLVGSWLIAEEYAESEMRMSSSSNDELSGYVNGSAPPRRDRRRRTL